MVTIVTDFVVTSGIHQFVLSAVTHFTQASVHSFSLYLHCSSLGPGEIHKQFQVYKHGGIK